MTIPVPGKEEKQFGDLIVKRTESLGGIEIWSKEKNKMICYFNEKGMKELADWITVMKEDNKQKAPGATTMDSFNL